MRRVVCWFAPFSLLILTLGCEPSPYVERPPAPANEGIYSFADGCYAIDATPPGSDNTRYLRPTSSGERFKFAALDTASASHFYLKASDLGTYLLRDQAGAYLLSDEGRLDRRAELGSDVLLVDDSFRSPAEWEVAVSVSDPERFQLRQRSSGLYLTKTGLTDDVEEAAVIAFYPQSDCAPFPEMTLDATGSVMPRAFPDGDLFGIADSHSHLFSNYGFGGSGVIHGSAFHRLGVEHALSDCETYHGAEGRQDLMGFFYGDDAAGLDTNDLANVLISGSTPEFNHFTDGYPDFTDWPNARESTTHQTQYYKWVERAYLGGLRLLVQHATANRVLCQLIVGIGAQPSRYSCNEMVGVERSIDETYALERYVDAQSGGPGMGWFRVVTSPAAAREVIGEGKMAVVLGIETANLFDCFLTPGPDDPTCDEAYVRDRLDHFRDRGVSAIFPVHKYDNQFSAGDGHRGFIELGGFINSGHYSNYTTDCPAGAAYTFDHGPVTFGGLNMPRADYLSPAPVDMSGFEADPIGSLLGVLGQITEPGLPGEYCQAAGLQPLGEYLMEQLMLRGMIIEIDHLPQRAYARAFEMLVASDYPAAGTHGNTNGGQLFQLGGISNSGLGSCGDPAQPGTMGNRLRAQVQEITDNGGYPGVPFGFDLGGFAHPSRPRFGPDSGCSQPQGNPITYPFTSYDGNVTFEEPRLGTRTVDYNNEGMVHIGLMPELIEDARRDGVTDADLEPIFRSAEAYVRMWERAELRGAALLAAAP